MASEWLKTYDEIYFVRPREDHAPTEDGVRSVDKAFIYAIDQLFLEFIESNPINVSVIYTDEVFA